MARGRRKFLSSAEIDEEISLLRPVSTPADLGKRFYFPHLSRIESALWRALWRLKPEHAAPTIYDLMLGSGGDVPAGASQALAEYIALLCYKRADAYQKLRNKIRIYELKREAGVGAIGQLLCYDRLYRWDYGDELPVELWLVTNLEFADMRDLCRHFGINFVVIDLHLGDLWVDSEGKYGEPKLLVYDQNRVFP